MSWRITGNYYGPCSCKISCPCELGEMEADQGWCSGILALDIRSGNVDGVSVSGTKVVLDVDFPGGMLSGNGTARLYFDPAVSPQQRAALEAVLGGQRGGVFGALAPLMTKVLPSKEAPITIQTSPEETRLTVGHYGEAVVKPLRGATGEYTRLLHGSVALRDDVILAKGTGTRWHDPELRQWESLGHGELFDFDWSG